MTAQRARRRRVVDVDDELSLLMYRVDDLFGYEAVRAALARAFTKVEQRKCPFTPDVFEDAAKTELRQLVRLQ